MVAVDVENLELSVGSCQFWVLDWHNGLKLNAVQKYNFVLEFRVAFASPVRHVRVGIATVSFFCIRKVFNCARVTNKKNLVDNSNVLG